MRPLLALALLLAACGPFHQPTECVTPCGVYVYGEADCRDIARAEAEMLAAFGPQRPDMCQHIRNWNLSIGLADLHSDPWRAPGEAPVSKEDQVWCDFHGVQLMTLKAYLHAMAHVEQCPGVTDYAHTTWTWQWAATREGAR